MEILKSLLFRAKSFDVAGPTLLTAGVFLLLALWPLSRNGWNPSWFHKFGEAGYVRAENLPPGARLFPGVGYDGQFYYAMAQDPFGRDDGPKQSDGPAYRYGRVGLSWAAGALSFGRPLPLSWAFLFLNFVSLVLGTWSTASLFRRFGRTGWWGLAFGFSGGLLVSFLYGTTECLCFGLLAFGLFLVSSRRWGWAALFFSWAALTRETALYGMAGGLFFGRLHPEEKIPRWVFVVPVAAYFSWQLYVRLTFGEFSFYNGATRLIAGSIPFSSFIAQVSRPDALKAFPSFMLLLVLMAMAGAAVRVWKRRGLAEAAVLFSALLATKLSAEVWSHPANFVRVLNDVFFWALAAGAVPGGGFFLLPSALNALASLPVVAWLSRG